jgi:hypothetical protein
MTRADKALVLLLRFVGVPALFALVVIRGARGSSVRGAVVRAGPPRLLERWNSMTPSLCETCALMREIVTPTAASWTMAGWSARRGSSPAAT